MEGTNRQSDIMDTPLKGTDSRDLEGKLGYRTSPQEARGEAIFELAIPLRNYFRLKLAEGSIPK